jgi:hypothetical protein
VYEVIWTLSANAPVWESELRVQVAVFVPEEPSCQQSGTPPVAVSSDAFLSSPDPDGGGVATLTFTPAEVAELPAAS